ncbi:hypothetical protein IC757_12240 [Wenzhouxiangella sp. AB-CW3]|uniref:hypothetical protein n=1 Tax=Wenzhouxiangella sp. AB-CW3 TaxID=2771012 RepID=UPI00168BB465|nr:hypothetical protein [Wenzhouxiangella sp. AB-CW3]QOC21799.1 hypothetical protein IC757_12240 [Wenzhouxiangella sp. AB-CW3]
MHDETCNASRLHGIDQEILNIMRSKQESPAATAPRNGGAFKSPWLTSEPSEPHGQSESLDYIHQHLDGLGTRWRGGRYLNPGSARDADGCHGSAAGVHQAMLPLIPGALLEAYVRNLHAVQPAHFLEQVGVLGKDLIRRVGDQGLWLPDLLILMRNST